MKFRIYVIVLLSTLLGLSACARKTTPVFIPVPQTNTAQFDAYTIPANQYAALALQEKRKILTEYETEELKLQAFRLADRASSGKSDTALRMVLPMATMTKAKVTEMEANGCGQCDIYIRTQLQNARPLMPAFTPLSPFSYQLQSLDSMYSSLSKMRQCGVAGNIEPRVTRIEQLAIEQRLLGQEIIANMKAVNNSPIVPAACQHPLFNSLVTLTNDKVDRMEKAMDFYYRYAANPPPVVTVPLPAQPAAPAQSFQPYRGVIAPVPQNQGI